MNRELWSPARQDEIRSSGLDSPVTAVKEKSGGILNLPVLFFSL